MFTVRVFYWNTDMDDDEYKFEVESHAIECVQSYVAKRVDSRGEVKRVKLFETIEQLNMVVEFTKE